MKIEYTKEGMRIIHPSGVTQLLTLEDLHWLWGEAKKEVERAQQSAEEIHTRIIEVEKRR